ncbi:MAG: DNA topoisomerase (ATP-hydrolyzing), partial [Ornithinimicrobium sp.]
MARRTRPSAQGLDDVEERIIDVDVQSEMQGAFLEYAYSVIYSRALPDARDGLKPVQRRILYGMSELGLRPDRAHVKCSRVVGEVMGKYHPHGDLAIYEAMVRLAQPWTMRLPLVDGHGNFGSLDDGPAASRYTEARMASSALLMTTSLDEETVDFVPNYDDQLMQPDVLPAAYPNLLVNGASGIAVGMATNMAPHNLAEVIGAARHLISNPDAGLDDLMRFVPGPDLPAGGTIVGLEGIREAYEHGRGSFKTRATARIENITARRKGIVVTELPYLVGPEKVIERVKQLVQSKKLQGISGINDLTDRHTGMQLVIEVKTGFHPEAVLERLYALTPMQDSFGINNVALVEGRPRTMGLRELLKVYVDFRVEVVRRRTVYRLGRRQDRLHLVAGLLVAIADIDEVIQVIRSSDDAATAKARLVAVFELTETQAGYILDLQLRRLTKFSRIELETEREDLEGQIRSLQALLEDSTLLLQT